MGEVHSLDDSFHWSISKLAKCFGLHRQTMAKKLEAAQVVPSGEVRGNPVYSVHDAARALYSTGASSPVDLDQYPEARKAWYQSENERIKFETSTGQLIHQGVFVREMSQLVKNLVNSMEALPDQLERDLGLTPDVVAAVQVAIDAAREQMYLKVIKDKAIEDDD